MRRISRQRHSSPVVFPWHRDPILDLIMERRCPILDPKTCRSKRLCERLCRFAEFSQTACVIERCVTVAEPGGADYKGPLFGMRWGGDILDY